MLALVKAAMVRADELKAQAKKVRSEAVTQAMDAGVSAQEIADELGVNRSYVYQLRKDW